MNLLTLVRRCVVVAMTSVPCMFTQTASAGVVLNVDSSGVLTGASGVTVLGQSYSVSFIDGTCLSVFSGCTGSSFVFNTEGAAEAASQALLDTVFVGLFDVRPGLAEGCDRSFGGCLVIIPYFRNAGNQFLAVAALPAASAPGSKDLVIKGLALNEALDTRVNGSLTFALFSLEAPNSSVPEPTVLALLALAGLALVGFQLRRRSSPQV